MRPSDVPPSSPPTTTTIPQASRIDPESIGARRNSDGTWTATVDGSRYSVSATGGSTPLPDGSELYVDPQTGSLYVDPAGDEPPALVADGQVVEGRVAEGDSAATTGQGTMPPQHALGTRGQGTMPA